MTIDDERPSFWRDNWLWFAAPLLVFSGLVAWLVFDAPDSTTTFTYDHRD